jgi:hypothetical protein
VLFENGDNKTYILHKEKYQFLPEDSNEGEQHILPAWWSWLGGSTKGAGCVEVYLQFLFCATAAAAPVAANDCGIAWQMLAASWDAPHRAACHMRPRALQCINTWRLL